MTEERGRTEVEKAILDTRGRREKWGVETVDRRFERSRR
jgi:hypothetical protein